MEIVMLEDGQPVERVGGRFRQLQLLNTGVVKLTGLKAAG
jgi:hypothetical protein